VYKATDSRLDRTVAIKVLPAHVAAEPDLQQRFEREARTLAALSHPHICPIHDVGSQDGIDFLVMEYLEGQTLEERLKKGALPLDQALQIAIQIADALAAAHRAGIVHRDLKPGNVMLTRTGATLLDFGLAKTRVSAVASRLSMLPTTPPGQTQPGAILGTFQYMAPEQLEGREADARTDLFAFGALVYEMVTGKKAFEGKSQASLIAAILEREPQPLSSLQPLTPPLLDHVVGRCLVKHADERWQSASDVMRELKWIAEAGTFVRTSASVGSGGAASTSSGAQSRRRGALLAVAATLAVVALAGAAAWLAFRSAATPVRVSRLTIAPTGPATPSVGGNDRDLAITPDGTRVVYVGNNGTQLFVRPLDQLDATVLATGAPRCIFVSPDGQWVGFADGTSLLKKVAITGGPPITIARLDGGGPRGATWLPDDTIVFATNSAAGGLQRVPANGGEVTVLTQPDRERGEVYHVFPEVLPDGHSVLFTIMMAGGPDQAQIAALDLATGTQTIVAQGGSHAHYVPTGHLVYAAGGSLRAVGFDADRLETRGTQVPVVPRLVTVSSGAADFDVSGDGTLAYLDGPGGALPGNRTLVWVDRQGREEPLAVPSHAWTYPRISPDGARVAVASLDQESDIWVADAARQTLTRWTFDPGLDNYPIWTPDGRRILFFSRRDAVPAIYGQPADGVGSVERLTGSSLSQPTGISPDGMELVFNGAGREGMDVMRLSLTGERRVQPLVQTPFTDRNGVVSSDGRWLAYESDSSGRFEIYVRPFPDTGSGQRQVSTAGGTRALWAHSGRELFFMGLDGALMRVAVEAKGGAWSAGTPAKLLEPKYFGTGSSPGRTYDISPDGQKFLMIKQGSSDQAPPPQIVVVQHWTEELKRLVPAE